MARLFVDGLSVIDFSYLDTDRGVVGESWIVDIELTGSLDDQGMVFDFGSVKKQIKQFVDAEIDHRLLVPIASPNCEIDVDAGELKIEFPLISGGVISHQSPKDAVLLVDAQVIESDGIASELQSRIKSTLPGNVEEVRVNLRQEDIYGAYYQYTHGLQKHLGQCQRIAHGHRSRIHVYIDGERNAAVEARWAEKLKDGYIATEEHISEEYEVSGIPHTRMDYLAQQGKFSIGVPSDCVFIMSTESTVENIAAHLAQLIAHETKTNVMVKAFEGLDKGAFGEAGG